MNFTEYNPKDKKPLTATDLRGVRKGLTHPLEQ